MIAKFHMAESAYAAGGKVRCKIGACIFKIGTKTEVGMVKTNSYYDTLTLLGHKLADLRHFDGVLAGNARNSQLIAGLIKT